LKDSSLNSPASGNSSVVTFMARAARATRAEDGARHSKWKLGNSRKRHSDEVELELQRILTTIRWRDAGNGILAARILAEHSVEDLVLGQEAGKHPGKTLVLESGKGVFVRMPGPHSRIRHYNQSLQRVIGFAKNSGKPRSARKKFKRQNQQKKQPF
jgi:hypothetical protein